LRDYLAKRCQRANPDRMVLLLFIYNVVLKTLRDNHPCKLHSLLRPSYLEEPRKGGLGKFFDKSKTRVGKQWRQFRLDHLRLTNRSWNGANLSNDSIWILLKDTFFNYRYSMITLKINLYFWIFFQIFFSFNWYT